MASDEQRLEPGMTDKAEVETAAELEAQAAEYKDKWMRTAADFDNYVKRQQRDRQKQENEVTMRVVKKLLPTMDDLDRALRHMPEELSGDAWVQGVVLIERKFRSLLDDFNLKPIETVGKPFDPNYHEALMTAASDKPEGTILEEYTKGYMLGDQVVRVATVQVSSGPKAR